MPDKAFPLIDREDIKARCLYRHGRNLLGGVQGDGRFFLDRLMELGGISPFFFQGQLDGQEVIFNCICPSPSA